MAYPVEFRFQNKVLTHQDKLKYIDLPVYSNGKFIVSCWELSADDVDELVRQHKAGEPYRIYTCVMSPDDTIKPMLLGTETYIRRMVADIGKVWKNA